MPPSAAAMTGPAPSPHENALRSARLPLLRDWRLVVELLLFDARLWVRVAITTPLSGFTALNGWGRGGGPVEKRFQRSLRRSSWELFSDVSFSSGDAIGSVELIPGAGAADGS